MTPQEWGRLIRDSTFDKHAKSVGAMLALRADYRTGECWPSQERLIEDTGISESSVKSGIRALKDAGWLMVVLRKYPDPNLYRLLDPPDLSRIIPDRREAVENHLRGVAPRPLKAVRGVAPRPQRGRTTTPLTLGEGSHHDPKEKTFQEEGGRALSEVVENLAQTALIPASARSLFTRLREAGVPVDQVAAMSTSQRIHALEQIAERQVRPA